MASVTHAGATFNTTAGNKTVVATPAVGDIIVVISAATGVATASITDNNGIGGTYTQVGSDRTGWDTTGHLQTWVRNAPIFSASSTTFTASQASSSGGGLSVFRISGMTRTGSFAVRSSGGQSSGTAGTTPAPVLDNTPLTGNPIIAAVANASGGATTVVQRTGYTEAFDNGYATPSAGLETSFLNSGETSATITFGGNSGTAFGSVALELDTSDMPGPIVIDVKESSWTGSTSPLTTVHAGALTGDKILVIAFGDGGLASGNAVTSVTTTTTAGTTDAWTEIEEFLPTGARGWLHAAITTVTADGSVTTSTARSQNGTARSWGKWSVLLRNAGEVGNHTQTNSGSAENVSLSTSQDSFVALGWYDYDAVTVATGFTPPSAIEVERTTDGTNGSRAAGYWVVRSAGSANYGTNDTSSSTNIDLVLVEILAVAGGPALAPLTMAPRIPA